MTPLLTALEAAQLLRLDVRTVYDIPEDQLPRYRLGRGRGAVRFAMADVEAYAVASYSGNRACQADGPRAQVQTLTTLTAKPRAYAPTKSQQRRARKAAPCTRRAPTVAPASTPWNAA